MASEETLSAAPAQNASATVDAAPTEASAAPEKLDEIEEIDFLLEEIESKIAPLALA
ncbi:Xan family putative trans-acting RiPP leader peptide [Corallococcus macrosporus]|uniref:Uncharacterized protein n=2 Tax=Myxococcaceae TaxID=31 RepID=A0A250JQK8_9BACT|nr:Xan family putative trans-acting RiPP leader peptide [Corallococcus macrosporus]AEI62069.1 hypothetical protein LILAB_00685 [Corallococcus macrosporus]ATB46139.1 hypothetical protein MYMAC_001731 [Corallococcus macrosporus DSM 14697]